MQNYFQSSVGSNRMLRLFCLRKRFDWVSFSQSEQRKISLVSNGKSRWKQENCLKRRKTRTNESRSISVLNPLKRMAPVLYNADRANCDKTDAIADCFGLSNEYCVICPCGWSLNGPWNPRAFLSTSHKQIVTGSVAFPRVSCFFASFISRLHWLLEIFTVWLILVCFYDFYSIRTLFVMVTQQSSNAAPPKS